SVLPPPTVLHSPSVLPPPTVAPLLTVLPPPTVLLPPSVLPPPTVPLPTISSPLFMNHNPVSQNISPFLTDEESVVSVEIRGEEYSEDAANESEREDVKKEEEKEDPVESLSFGEICEDDEMVVHYEDSESRRISCTQQESQIWLYK
ncbi:hypothetical protein PFISCL1PPCAC_6738, partial [Pristionchus fissidentatus]